MAISDAIDAAHTVIENNWQFRTNPAHSAEAMLEAIDLLLTVRPIDMEKGGGTAESIRFDHATLQRMRASIPPIIAAGPNETSGSTIVLSNRCYRD